MEVLLTGAGASPIPINSLLNSGRSVPAVLFRRVFPARPASNKGRIFAAGAKQRMVVVAGAPAEIAGVRSEIAGALSEIAGALSEMEEHVEKVEPQRVSPATASDKGGVFASGVKQRMVEVAGAPAEIAGVWSEMEEHVEKVEKGEGFEEEEDEGRRVTPEELEKMEREAMEGKDEGRAPLDYDRRARIFYESSRVFGDVNC